MAHVRIVWRTAWDNRVTILILTQHGNGSVLCMQQSRPREIRSLIAQLFAEIEPGVHQVDRETLLIRDGQYCGHRYQTGRLTAVWFLEENQIKIHDESGQVLRVVSPTTDVRSGQQAA